MESLLLLAMVIGLIFVVFIAGCATTQTSSEVPGDDMTPPELPPPPGST